MTLNSLNENVVAILCELWSVVIKDFTVTIVSLSFKINCISVSSLAGAKQSDTVWYYLSSFKCQQLPREHSSSSPCHRAAFLCLCWWVLFCIGGSTYWGIQINVAAFNFSLFLSLSFTPRLFNFPWSFFSVASVHPGDRCTIGALKLRNVYIIHITPQKVLIKLYVANGVGSRGLKVLPISQMSQRIDRERREPCWGFDSRMALI